MTAVDMLRDALFGNPPSADFKPSREGVLEAFRTLYEAAGQMGLAGAVDVVFATRAALDANLNHPANTIALVHDDAIATNNDIYVKIGESGVGSWDLIGALHSIAEQVASTYVTQAAAQATRAEAAADEIAAIITDGETIPGSVNLYDYTTLTNQALIDAQGGTGAGGMYRATDFIPVKANTTYIVERGIRAEYDANKNFLRGYPHTAYGPGQWPVGANTAFVRFNVEMGDNPGAGIKFDKIMLVEGTQLPASFVPYKPAGLAKRIPNLRVNADQVVGLPALTPTAALPFAGKKLLALGDSITQATSYSGTANAIAKPYHAILAERLGFTTVYNRGIGGSSIQKRQPSNGYDWNALYPPLCDANRIAALPADADVVTILMGVNDISHPLGTVDGQDEYTLFGALNSALAQLTAKYAGKPILIFTPLPYKAMSGSSPINLPDDAFAPGTTQVSQTIIAACKRWGIPYFDLNSFPPFTNYDAASKTAYIPDALHPNGAGHARMAAVMETPLRALAA